MQTEVKSYMPTTDVKLKGTVKWCAKDAEDKVIEEYSGSNNIDNVGWHTDNSSSTTHLVGTKQPNELGIYDMSGNVYEWCSGIYKPYPGCTGETHDTRRVLRGGSWRDVPEKCRTTNRIHGATSSAVIDFGFRLAKN